MLVESARARPKGRLHETHLSILQSTVYPRGVAEPVSSKSGLPIRLTDERWAHITEEHAELAGFRYDVLEAIANPERIVAGNAGELLAMQTEPDGQGDGCRVS
jgi:hypothetical protein